MEVIATLCLSNFGGIELLETAHGVIDKVKFRYNFGTPGRVTTAHIRYNSKGIAFFRSFGRRLYFEKFIRKEIY